MIRAHAPFNRGVGKCMLHVGLSVHILTSLMNESYLDIIIELLSSFETTPLLVIDSIRMTEISE